ncbi:MAG: hypothetical protein KKF46_06765 [Nanoarchaeota archaeon]|nr:hypothetical protein [Nanoarchaeota archaeon]MBU1322031.1 hypothetical protein [Nanoarchaeota archaeon]MBU1597223.1 hypothetical protein [Nanoarchaeota archaeon]MBU2440732.1 hypothetical protein [Nanoarchaeota archaeon]
MIKKKVKKKIKEKSVYWNTQSSAFINSYKRIGTKEFLKSAVFDLLTFLAIIIILNLALLMVNRISAEVLPELLTVYASAQSEDTAAMQEAVADLTPRVAKVLWISFIIVVFAFLLIMLAISFLYHRAWDIALKKNLKKKFSWKIFLLNIIWFVAWFIIFLLTANIFVTSVAAVILLIEILLFLYLDPMRRSIYDEKKSIGKIISDFFRIGVKIYWFIFYIIAAVIFGIIIIYILGLLVNILVLFGILTVIFILIFVGWTRNYIIELTKHIQY